MKLVAGGNAPGKEEVSRDPERVALFPRTITREPFGLPGFDPFRVGKSLQLSGGDAPGY
jgi:hypothetical protein